MDPTSVKEMVSQFDIPDLVLVFDEAGYDIWIKGKVPILQPKNIPIPNTKGRIKITKENCMQYADTIRKLADFITLKYSERTN